jgi:hypothetical protein
VSEPEPLPRRIRRARPVYAAEATQSPPPLEVNPELAVRAHWDVSFDIENDLSGRAESISENYYSPFYEKIRTGKEPWWPTDFESQFSGMDRASRTACKQVHGALGFALTSQWIGLLSPLEFKMMVYINNRTWGWGKPMEAISLKMFRLGHYIGRECTQVGISGSDTRLGGAWRGLQAVGLLRSGLALQANAHNTALDTIRWYEIDVPIVLHTANQLRADSTRARTLEMIFGRVTSR